MKRRIMQAAMIELHERGLKFTMDDLARRLGMSKRTLYENFASKEELISFLLAEGVAEIKARREAIARDETLNISEKFRRMMTVRPVMWSETADHISIDIKRCMPEQWQTVESAMDEQWAMIEDLMREGVRTGEFRPVFSPALRAMFKGAFNVFANYNYLLKHKITVKEMIDHMLDILMYGLVAPDCDSRCKGCKEDMKGE